MACLDNVIKLSRTECECFDDDKPLDYNEGQSEVYLDELEGFPLSFLNASANCEGGSLWDILAKARENATLQFKADLLSCINDSYQSKRPNYSGVIGQTTFNSTLNITDNMAGVKYIFPTIVGGKMIVKRIGVMVNASTNVTVKVFNNDENSTTAIAQYTIAAAANSATFATLVTPLELPLWSKNGVQLEYYFVYSLTGAFLPKNNKPDCGCGGNKTAINWKQWINAYGIKGNSANAFSTFTSTTELNGLVVDAEFKCDMSRLICSDEYPMDFTSGRDLQIAYAIRFKAGALAIDNALSLGEINRFTMLDREALYGKRNHYRKQYEDLIPYLCNVTQNLNNDCLMCRPNSNFVKGKILS